MTQIKKNGIALSKEEKKELIEKVEKIAGSNSSYDFECVSNEFYQFISLNSKKEKKHNSYKVRFGDLYFNIYSVEYPNPKSKKSYIHVFSSSDERQIYNTIINLYDIIFNTLPTPKFKVGDTIVMKDNEDYEIVIEVIDEDEDGFIYYEGSDEYAGSIREEDAVLATTGDTNSVYNTFARLLES